MNDFLTLRNICTYIGLDSAFDTYQRELWNSNWWSSTSRKLSSVVCHLDLCNLYGLVLIPGPGYTLLILGSSEAKRVMVWLGLGHGQGQGALQ